ncbi:pyocin knob domain-containing protein [Pseudescherichia vulneris]
MGVFDKRTVKRAPRVLRRKNIGALREQLQNSGELVSLTSQHSMVIEDDTGLNVRLDINDAFQAQASNQIGSTEPPVMYAGQLWADTGTMKLRQRNSANTAWVEMAILDKTAVLTVNGVNADANGNIAVSFTVDDVQGAVPETRKVNGHALSTDINVTSSDIFNGQAVSLGGGDNINSKTTAGLYYNAANSNATSANNYPSTNAGALLVMKDPGCTQVYYEYGAANSNKPRIYHRGFYSNTWSSWEQVYDSGNQPPYPVTSVNGKTGAVSISAADTGAITSIVPTSGGVGETALMLSNWDDHSAVHGGTLAGSVLQFGGAVFQSIGSGGGNSLAIGDGVPAGTWRCTGSADRWSNYPNGVSTFQRIS